MTAAPGETALGGIRNAITWRFGLAVDTARVSQVLNTRLQATRLSAIEYLALIEKGSPATPRQEAELRMLAQYLSVPETHFFRYMSQFEALRHEVMPRLLAEREPCRSVRAFSAGCASGEEPYSLAIVLMESLPPGWQWEVHAADMNQAVLEKARLGRFTEWSLRDLPDETRRRWFTQEGREYVLARSIRDAVKFYERNLLDDDPILWQPQTWDIVFFRNVMMYLTPSNARSMIARIEQSLARDGFLFLGHAETLRGISNRFHLCHSNEAFFYRKRGGSPASPEPLSLLAPAASPAFNTAPPDDVAPLLANGDSSWVDAVALSSRKVQPLLELRTAGEPAPQETVPPGGLARVLSLLEGEQYAEALSSLEAMPGEAASEPDVLLVRAVLLTHDGRFPSAEESCKSLLAMDRANAGARYLLALCREAAGDLHGAVDEARAAAYLDPGFSMPRLKLGLLARRAGKLTEARRDLNQALSLLRREDASRILLFGGGFGRNALLSLCQAEILASGGTS